MLALPVLVNVGVAEAEMTKQPNKIDILISMLNSIFYTYAIEFNTRKSTSWKHRRYRAITLRGEQGRTNRYGYRQDEGYQVDTAGGGHAKAC
jgi:hypothetical protein